VFGVLFKVRHVVSVTILLHYGDVWGGGGRRLSAVGGEARICLSIQQLSTPKFVRGGSNSLLTQMFFFKMKNG